MATRPLTGWDATAPIRRAGTLGRLAWPALVLAAFGALVGVTLARDPSPGLSDRGWAIAGIGAVLALVLSVRRRAGAGAIARTLAEWLLVVVLVVALGQLPDAPPSHSPTRQPPAEPPTVVVIDETPAGGFLEGLARVWRDATGRAKGVRDAVR